VGFVLDKVALGEVFSEYFDFPCQPFLRLLHNHRQAGAGTTSQIVADVPNGLSLTPSEETKKTIMNVFRRKDNNEFHRSLKNELNKLTY
jgi:hypothetical protein